MTLKPAKGAPVRARPEGGLTTVRAASSDRAAVPGRWSVSRGLVS